MGTNCLVTKLKSQVANDNLEKLGVLKFNVVATEDSSANRRLYIDPASGKQLSATAFGGYVQLEYGNTETQKDSLTLPNNAVFMTNNDFTLEVKSKYDITRIQLGLGIGINFSTFNYPSNITIISSPVQGNTAISGNIEGLANTPSIEEIRTLYCSNLGGTLEKLIEGLVKANKSTDLELRIGGSGVKFNNNIISPSLFLYCAFSSNACTIYSDSAKTVEVASYNGSTWTYNS